MTWMYIDIDDLYPEVKIYGVRFWASTILLKLEPTMWLQAEDDLVESICDDLYYKMPTRPTKWREAGLYGVFWEDETNKNEGVE